MAFKGQYHGAVSKVDVDKWLPYIGCEHRVVTCRLEDHYRLPLSSTHDSEPIGDEELELRCLA